MPNVFSITKKCIMKFLNTVASLLLAFQFSFGQTITDI
ncbi:MAG: hypothetical protein RLY31_2558, partial [Bacteroidota bacterium]